MHRYSMRTFGLEVLMYVVAIFFAFPLYILVNLSIRSTNDTSAAVAPTLRPTFQNYIAAWDQAGLASALVSSAIITSVSVLLLVTISSMAAYPLVRLTSRLSTIMYWFLVVGLLLPFQVAMIPLYQTMRDLGLLGSPISLMLYYAGAQMPFSVFLYSGFLRAAPKEYEEAAATDGASSWTTFWRIVFPMLRPVTATVVILNAIGIWNDFLVPLLYLSGSDQQTLPVSLYSFLGEYGSDWNLVFAGLVIALAPILVVYFALQRLVVNGFAGGLKA